MSLRNSSTRRARSAWGSAALEISFRKMMLVPPPGPITLISAVGHATITSGSYARPHMTKYPAPYALRSTTVSFGTVASLTAYSILAPWRMMPARSTFEPTRNPGTSCRNTSGMLNASHNMMKRAALSAASLRSEEHTSELQSRLHLVCRLLLEKKKKEKHKDLSYPT